MHMSLYTYQSLYIISVCTCICMSVSLSIHLFNYLSAYQRTELCTQTNKHHTAFHVLYALALCPQTALMNRGNHFHGGVYWLPEYIKCRRAERDLNRTVLHIC